MRTRANRLWSLLLVIAPACRGGGAWPNSGAAPGGGGGTCTGADCSGHPSAAQGGVNECDAGTHACGAGATCVDAPEGYRCACPAGSWSPDGRMCVDVDECGLGIARCSVHAVCSNRPGGYECSCNDAYYGDGVICEPVPDGALCRQGTDTTACVCRPRYLGDGRVCTKDCGGGAACDHLQWWQLTLGARHTCALREDKSLWCWGANDTGQVGDGSWKEQISRAPVGEETSQWEYVDAGMDHTCAIQSNGALWCWGANDYGQLGDDTTRARATPMRVGNDREWSLVTAGDYHTCAIRFGDLSCWGRNDRSQLGDGTDANRVAPIRIGAGMEWTHAAAGAAHTCGLDATGAAWCWGSNERGQLGTGSAGSGEPTPVRVSDEGAWSELVAGGAHTCVVGDGALWCWGANDAGQMGDATLADRASPTSVAGTWRGVTAGERHTCGLSGDELWCWGTGEGIADGTLTPQKVTADDEANGWRVVAAGRERTCGHRDGRLRCLGDGRFREPVEWTSVSLGNEHTCGLRDGGLWCWGANVEGQLGVETDPLSLGASAPVHIGTDTDWVQVAAGVRHTCGIRAGMAWCWGENTGGQVGDGAVAQTTTPEKCVHRLTNAPSVPCRRRPTQVGWDDPTVESGRRYAADWNVVAAGGAHSCGLRAATPWCWGANSNGQLGDGTTVNRADPVRVGNERDWDLIAAGSLHTCGLRNGTLWCWGNNGYGQLGDWTTQQQTAPVRGGSESDWEGIAAAGTHTCGFRALPQGSPAIGATLWCWGSNRTGQLGNGTTVQQTAPVRVGSESDWEGIAAGGDHTCGLRAGSLWCWGDNYYGQLGSDAGGTRALVPVGVHDDWHVIAAGAYHSCGLRAGTLWCWGSNGWGQLGVGPFDSRSDVSKSPVRVSG